MSVVSRQESGARGYAVTLAKYGPATMNKWRRRGAGKNRNPSLLEILEAEREAARLKATARRGRRSTSRGGKRITDAFDFIS